MPELIRTVRELKTWRRSLDPSVRVGLVPTMGALHEGHARLAQEIRPRCDRSVLSIFVNPTQFGPHEDLERYPRTLERDLQLAQRSGVDMVFVPDASEIYPQGFSTYVEETSLSTPLCGRFRPGHFRGVTTVVLRLFLLVEPSIALFGLKDAQQFLVIHRMARDFGLEVSVEAMRTVRENDGLALSSRNAYLSPDTRARHAPLLARSLRLAAGDLARGASLGDSLARARARLAGPGMPFDVQYLEGVLLPDLTHCPPSATWRKLGEPPLLIAAAAFLVQRPLEGTRLIDNVIVGEERLASLGIIVH